MITTDTEQHTKAAICEKEESFTNFDFWLLSTLTQSNPIQLSCLEQEATTMSKTPLKAIIELTEPFC